ncbi:hypothetical protein G9A89_008645 [Geosiphon pyriformis]|nr:hypothetical protein G9A89_008645 [Geosiphon pyriformis]
MSSSTGGSGSGSAGLGTHQSAKNKCVDTVYACGASYKKLKKPAAGVLVESSAGPLHLEDLGGDNSEPAASWRSKVGSISGNVSGLSDVENLENLVAKETSYVDSSKDDKIDETTPHRTRTQTYVLEQSLKVLLFVTMNDDDDDSILPPSKINEFNQLPSSKSRVLKSCSFRPVKLFALNVNLSAVSGRSNASTPSKFPGVICSTFTSESSLIKAREMAVCEKIVVNGDLKKANICLNQEVVIKKIPVDLLKVAVESVFSRFGKLVSIRMQLIGLWQKTRIKFESSEVASLVASKWSVLVGKDSVCIALAVCDKQTTSAHDLSDLLMSYGGKTCFIGCDPSSYVHNQYAIICFESEAARLAAVYTIPIFKGVSLHWASLVLASCAKCKQFGHIHADCSVGESSGAHGKRVVSDQDRAQVAGGIFFHALLSGFSGYDLRSGLVPPSAVSDHRVAFHLSDCLVILEHFLELLADRVSGILVRLDFFGVVPLVPSSLVSPPVVSAALGFEVNSDMIVDNALSSSGITPPVIDNAVVNLSTSGSRVLTVKVGGLETKLVVLKTLVGSVLDKLNLLCSGSGMNNCAKKTNIVCWHKNMNNMVSIVTETKLKGKICPWIADGFDGIHVFTFGLNSGHMGSGVAIILNFLLARYVCKVSEVPGWLLLVRLLFKNKLSVLILGLYVGASSVVSMNESSFIVLGGDFNENGSHKYASFNKCFDLGLVNSLVVDHSVAGVDDFFNTDHKAVSVSVGIDAFLVRNSHLVSGGNFALLLKTWNKLNSSGVLVVKFLFFSGSGFNPICSALAKTKKLYHASKLLESKRAEKSLIKQAIGKRMESFELVKGYTIRSVLERPFCKVVLDYLVVGHELVLEPDSVKSKVDEIMEE